MTKLSIVSCALILGSLAVACGGSEGDDDGGEAGSGGTAASSGTGGSSASGGSSGSTGKGGSSGGGSGGTSGSAGTGGSGKGGSAGTGGSGGSSGSVNVPGSTPISDVDTDGEAEAVCEEVASQVDPDAIEALTNGTCVLAGLFAEAAGGGDCETAQAECLADPGEDPTTEGCTSQDFPDCDITVDEFVACTSARATLTAEAFGDLTCDSDITSIGEIEDPEECTALAERCPELIATE